MLEIVDTATTPAAPEEVWKLLYDPARLGEWWAGVARTDPAGGDRVDFVRDDGRVYPQRMVTDREGARVTVSCLTLGLRFSWMLAPLDGGGTRITACFELPEREVALLESQRAAIAASVHALGRLAATGAPRAPD
jgi:uncharacterized protein YndB with AHSA1/START domain